MSNVEINRVLGQIRMMQDQIGALPLKTQTDQAVDFGSILRGTIDTVNNHQQYAVQMSKAFERGDPGVNLSDVMIAGQKSGLAFQSMLQVRNKLVDAYKDVMNMPM
ncbi:MAG: Flagellar hook-basal body complex protein fliE [Pseudomonadota bacterium]|jgi:flagellar hook-basal body complex protein FliE